MNPFCKVSGLNGELAMLRRLRERGLLRHVVGDRVVYRKCCSKCRSRRAPPWTSWESGRQAKPMRGEILFLSGLTSEEGRRAGVRSGLSGQNLRDSGVAGRHVEIHQPVVQLGDRGCVVPADAEVEENFGLRRQSSVTIYVVGGGAEIEVAVAVAQGAGDRAGRAGSWRNRSPCRWLPRHSPGWRCWRR